MREHLGKALGVSAVGVGLLAFMIAVPSTSPLYGRTTESTSGDPDVQTQDQGSPANQQNTQQNTQPNTQQNAPATSGSQAGVNSQASAGNADSVIGAWPDEAKQAARKLIEKYGQPNGVLDDRLIWINNGQFKQTLVYRDGVEHNFPSRHMDYVKQTIAVKVPANKIGDLEKFDGSLSYERTRGLLSCEDQSEDRNFLAFNLANDIIKGKKTVEQARSYFSRASQLAMSGKSSPELEGLDFNVSGASTGDPDKAMSGKSSSSSSSSPSSSKSKSSSSEISPSGSESTPSGSENSPGGTHQ